jgi:hypothetical protein
MPFEIVPASSITKLKFGGGYPVEFEMLCQAYQYMTKKYANVTEVDFENIELDDYEPSERKYVYLNGYLDFLKLIGPTQQELTLDFVPDGIDPSEVLGAVDPKIKQIWLYCCESETILRDLSRSNQSKYVQALILTESNIDSIHAIKDMTCLTELIVRFSGEDGPPVDLVGCLEACPPSIKFFAITYDRMVVKPLNILLESIETLEIRSRDLTTELGDIISFRFPNLVKLILDFQYLQDTNITLKSPRLQHVTFSKNSYALENNSEYGLSFKSPAQSEPKHYICDSQQTREVEGNLIEGLPTLSIEYFTNKILDLSKDIQVIPC